MQSFGTKDGWLVEEDSNHGPDSNDDKDTSHIPLFSTKTTNVDMVRAPVISAINVSMILSQKMPFLVHYIRAVYLYQTLSKLLKISTFEVCTSSLQSFFNIRMAL